MSNLQNQGFTVPYLSIVHGHRLSAFSPFTQPSFSIRKLIDRSNSYLFLDCSCFQCCCPSALEYIAWPHSCTCLQMPGETDVAWRHITSVPQGIWLMWYIQWWNNCLRIHLDDEWSILIGSTVCLGETVKWNKYHKNKSLRYLLRKYYLLYRPIMVDCYII